MTSLFHCAARHAVLLSFAVAGAATAATTQFYPNENAATPYSKAVRAGDTVYLAGQVGANAEGLVKGFEAQSKQTMDNVAALLQGLGLSMDDVVKCQVFMTDINKLNDFGKIYVGYFKPGHYPARTSVGVQALPRGADMEVECTAHVPGK